MSIDGEKLGGGRNVGQGGEWKDYKAVNLHGLAVAAYFQDNQALLTWVNQQELSEIVTCLGDRRSELMRISLLTLLPGKAVSKSKGWYHLVENLYFVGGDNGLLARVEAFLWWGNVAAAIAEFDG